MTVRRTATAEHWDSVRGATPRDQVSWFQERPDTSLRLLTRVRGGFRIGDRRRGRGVVPGRRPPRHGWSDVTVLDVSRATVAAVEERLTERAGVSFIVADLLQWRPGRRYDRGTTAPCCTSSPIPRSRRTTPRSRRPPSARAVSPCSRRSRRTARRSAPDCRPADTTPRCCRCSAARTSRWSITSARSTGRRGAVQPFTWAVLRRLQTAAGVRPAAAPTGAAVPVGPRGLEPRTYGLKVRSSAS